MWMIFATTTHAATIQVGPASPYRTLASAVYAAKPGDTIEIAAGTYPTDAQITFPITIRGAGSDKTFLTYGRKYGGPMLELYGANGVVFNDLTLSGSEQDQVLKVTSSTATFEGVAFVDGTSDRITSMARLEASTVTLRNVSFDGTGSIGDYGGMVLSQSTVLLVEDSLFTNGTARFSGGAVQLEGGDATFVNTVFEGNSARYGGAMYIEGGPGDTTRFEGCTFRENHTSDEVNGYNAYGGAMAVFASNLELVRSTFLGNTATFGGGAIDLTLSPVTTLEDNVFIGNIADHEGGSVAVYQPQSISVVRNRFESSSSAELAGR